MAARWSAPGMMVTVALATMVVLAAAEMVTGVAAVPSASGTVEDATFARKVVIKQPPENISVSIKMLKVVENSIAGEVRCDAKAVPNPYYYWNRADRPRPMVNCYILRFHSPFIRDESGSYSYTASNKYGNISEISTINVQYKPECEITLSEQYGRKVLTCTASANPPEVDFTWHFKGKCNYDDDCPPNAYCRYQEECDCMQGYFIVRKEDTKDEVCLKRANAVGDPCEEPDQCHGALGLSAECFQGTCRCSPWAHDVDNHCYNTSRVGQPCMSKNNCVIDKDVPLSCDRGVCVCPRLHHGSADGDRCIFTRWLGMNCTDSEQCLANHSQCVAGGIECNLRNPCEGRCSCNVHTILSSNGRRCLPVAQRVGDECEERAQCDKFIGNADCGAGGRCVCKDGFHAGRQREHCWRDVYLDEGCDWDEECLATPPEVEDPLNITRVRCSDGTCLCTEGFRGDSVDHYCIDGAVVSRSSAVLVMAVVFSMVVYNG